MSDDQYGDYSRRGEYEGQDPYAARRGYRTRGGNQGYAAGHDEEPYPPAPPAQRPYAGDRGDTAYPRSYGRDYSGRGPDQDPAAAPPSDPYGEYPTGGYQAGGAAGGYQSGGYASGYPAGTDHTGAEDYSSAREYRSYRRGEYRPREDYAGRRGATDPYTGEPTRSRRDVLGVIASSLFAVLAVLALVTVLWLMFRGGDDDPSTQAGGDTTPGNTASTSPSPSTTEGASQPPADVKAPVIVLNSVGVEGLAGTVSDQIAAEGWEMRTPDNYQPKLAETTVFFPAGENFQAAAMALQAAFPDILKVEPADDSMLQDALTVVIGDNWPSG